MFSGASKKDPKLETIVGTGTVIEGDLQTAEGIRIDGIVRGSVKAESVVVGPGGTIHGDILSNKVTVSGKVKGNVSAATLLELMAQGQIFGDIVTSKLIISEGAVFEGNSKRVKADGQIIELHPETGNNRDAQENKNRVANDNHKK